MTIKHTTVAKMRAEIERLRSIAFDAETYAQTVRKATIEECARVADEYGDWVVTGNKIAAAIRALKTK